MAKRCRKDPDKPEWQSYWEDRYFPAQLPEGKGLSVQDKLFALMIWFGFTKVDAYIMAYKTTASRNSVAAMSTRHSQEPKIANFIDAVNMAAIKGELKFKVIM